jgi:hypothetical protein
MCRLSSDLICDKLYGKALRLKASSHLFTFFP